MLQKAGNLANHGFTQISKQPYFLEQFCVKELAKFASTIAQEKQPVNVLTVCFCKSYYPAQDVKKRQILLRKFLFKITF